MSLARQIYEMTDQGASAMDIARRLGCSRNNVYHHLKKRAAATAEPAPERRRGWDEAKRDKAIRLYQAIVVMVAEALDVPPAELLSFWSKGKLPPERGAVSEIEGASVPVDHPGETGGGVTVPRAAPALPSAPVEPAPADSVRLFRLRTVGGTWLTKRGDGLTSVIEEAWQGTAEAARAVRARMPMARFCKSRPVGDE